MSEVIVVAEESVYNVLAESGTDWNLQRRADSVDEMWAGLRDGSISSASSILVFSDAVADQQALATAVATMAPHALVFVALWNSADANALAAAIGEASAAQGTNADYFFVPLRGEKEFLDNIKTVVQSRNPDLVTFPEVWGSNVAGLLHPSDVVAEVASAPVEVVAAEEPRVPDVSLAEEVAPAVAYEAEIPAPVGVAEVASAPAPVEVAPVAAAVAPPIAPPVAPPVAAPAAAPAPMATRPPVAPVGPPVAPVGPPVTPVGAPVAVTRPVAAAPTQAAPAAATAVAGGPLDGYQPPASNTTLTFFSSKGGSGKSTTAMMVATTIAHASKAAGNPLKVVLVDMDTRDGQVASLVGTYAPTALNIRVAEDWDEKTVLKNLIHSEKLGIDCLLAPIRPRTADDVGPDFYRHVIRVLQQTHDVVIMDCSVNYLDPLISTVCLPEAKAVLFVTTMATTAVQGMARALREITEPVQSGGMGIPRSKIGIVVNQSATNIGLDREQVTQAALSVPVVGAIPLSTTDVLKATNSNKMHFLIKHPNLGPAYLRLARVCVPDKHLPDLDGTPAPAGTAPAGIGQAPAPAAPQDVDQTPVPDGQFTDGAVQEPAGETEAASSRKGPRKRPLSFGRKG